MLENARLNQTVALSAVTKMETVEDRNHLTRMNDPHTLAREVAVRLCPVSVIVRRLCHDAFWMMVLPMDVVAVPHRLAGQSYSFLTSMSWLMKLCLL
jgi:hypothetical protein